MAAQGRKQIAGCAYGNDDANSFPDADKGDDDKDDENNYNWHNITLLTNQRIKMGAVVRSRTGFKRSSMMESMPWRRRMSVAALAM